MAARTVLGKLADSPNRAWAFALRGVGLERDAAHGELVRRAEHGRKVAGLGDEVAARAGEHGRVRALDGRVTATGARSPKIDRSVPPSTGTVAATNVGRAELHLVQPAPEAGLDDRGCRERRPVDHRAGTVVGRHRPAHRVVAELGNHPDLRVHMPGLQGELHVLQVLSDDAHDGARRRDASGVERLREAALRPTTAVVQPDTDCS